MSQPQFDVVIIGTGPASGSVMSRCLDAGLSVGIVDYQPVGGNCALRGCTPKKLLVNAARAHAAARRFHGHGVGNDPGAFVFGDAAQFRDSFLDPIPDKRMKSYAKRGVEVITGFARFAAPDALDVDGRRVTFGKCVIAAGARPATLGIPGEEFLETSDDFIVRRELPGRIVFLGGGYISMELAHLARHAGCEVAILQSGPRVLRPFDTDVVERLQDETRELGIRLELNAKAVSIERSSGELEVVCACGGDSKTLRGDLVVHGAGRVSRTVDMDLDRGEVANNNGIAELNPYLQSTTNPRVYIVGDAAGNNDPALTPVAGLHGRAVGKNLVEGNKHVPDLRGVASACFTTPAIAAVGMTEEAARKAGHDIKVKTFDSSRKFTALSHRISHGYSKVIVEKESDLLLGAHLFGVGVEDTINIFALAIRHGLTAGDIKAAPLTYPTSSYDIRAMV